MNRLKRRACIRVEYGVYVLLTRPSDVLVWHNDSNGGAIGNVLRWCAILTMTILKFFEIGQLRCSVHQPNRWIPTIHNGLNDFVLLFGRIMLAVADQPCISSKELHAAFLNCAQVPVFRPTTMTWLIEIGERPVTPSARYAQWCALVFIVFCLVCDDTLLQIASSGWDGLEWIHDGSFDVRLHDDLVRPRLRHRLGKKDSGSRCTKATRICVGEGVSAHATE